MSSALFYWFAIEEYSDIAGNSATCYLHFDRSACVTEIKQCIQRVKNKSWPSIMPKQREYDLLKVPLCFWQWNTF
jgi:hypothetical protein